MSGWWDEHRATAIRWGGVAALLLFAGTLLGRSIWTNDDAEQAPPPVHVEGVRALSGRDVVDPARFRFVARAVKRETLQMS